MRLRRLPLLLLGLVAAYVFMVGLAPLVRRLPGAREVIEGAEAAGVDATALWYTESSETGRAEARARDTIR